MKCNCISISRGVRSPACHSKLRYCPWPRKSNIINFVDNLIIFSDTSLPGDTDGSGIETYLAVLAYLAGKLNSLAAILLPQHIQCFNFIPLA